MRIVRVAICFIAFFAFVVIGLVIARPYLLKMSARSHAEKDYRKLVDEDKTEIYTHYPELIERVVADIRFAATITKVHLSGPNGANMDFESLRSLPNLSIVEITYGHQIDTIISVLNSISGLREVKFYCCGNPETILAAINNTHLTGLRIHSFQPSKNADQLLLQARERLPKCTIALTKD